MCFIFREGYSLLLHGLGSKRTLMNDFHREILADHPSLIVNGFFPSLTTKDVSCYDNEVEKNYHSNFVSIFGLLFLFSDTRQYNYGIIRSGQSHKCQ